MTAFTASTHPSRIDIPKPFPSLQTEADPFLLDFEKLLQHEVWENMSPYIYSTPDPELEYDQAGGEIYYNNVIHQERDYYLYQAEIDILQNAVDQLATYVPRRATLIELGVGTEIAFRKKTLPFLKAIDDLQVYAPLDINETYLARAGAIVARELPHVAFHGITTDFVKNVSLVQNFANPVVFFKGSTITNLSQDKCVDFLSHLSSALPAGGLLIVGLDSNNDEASLRRAYVTPSGARLLLSIFHRFERDYPVHNYHPHAFRYRFDWVPETYCGQHMAVATEAQTFSLHGTSFEIQAHEEFHLMSSYKYPIDMFQQMAKQGGFTPVTAFAEPANPMVIHVLRKE